MTVFIALLRAVNVGGTRKMLMSDLSRLCEIAGFAAVRTYIASGNVVFESEASEAEVKVALEEKLLAFAGKPIGVLVRSAAEMAAVLAANPFPGAAPNRSVTIFLSGPPAADTLEMVIGQQGEELRLGTREIYVHYVDGMSRSKLRIPAAENGTARNTNTLTKLVGMAAGSPER